MYTYYFAAHGLVHITVVAALLSGAHWAHSAATLTLVAFVAYQMFEWINIGGPMLLVLTAIDLIVIVLTLRERQRAQLKTS